MKPWLLTLLACLCLGCNAYSSSPELLGKIPFEFKDDMIFIKLKVNEEREQRFLFDTGASITLISKTLGDRLGLRNGNPLNNTGAAGHGSMEAFYGNTLSFGDIQIKNLTLMKNSLPMPKSSPVAESFEGAIGYDLLSRFLIKINYDSQELEFYSFGKMDDHHFGRSHDIDLSLSIPEVTATLKANDRMYKGKFLLDTGSQMPLILNSPFAKDNNVRANLTKTVSIIRKAGVSDASSEFVMFKAGNLEIFDDTFQHFPAALSTATSGALSYRNFDGIVGNPILKRYHITFDYSDRKMYFEPNKLYRSDFFENCLGLVFDIKVQAKRMITEYVMLGSPAEKAGFKAGDEIMSINNKPVADYDSEELNDLVSRPGKELQIKYVRGGKSLKTQVVLAKML